MIWYSIVTNGRRLSSLSIISRTGNNGGFTAVRLTKWVAGAMQISNHEASKSMLVLPPPLGRPCNIKEILLLVFFIHLVNVDALGVDVLGPRLAVEGHHLLRKNKQKMAIERLFYRMDLN